MSSSVSSSGSYVAPPWCPASTIFADRIAANQMILNFGRTRSPGGSSHEMGDG